MVLLAESSINARQSARTIRLATEIAEARGLGNLIESVTTGALVQCGVRFEVFDGEGGPAAAGRLGHGVVDHRERAADELLLEVHRRSADELQTRVVHDHRDVLLPELTVLGAERLVIDAELVLKARASAALDEHAQVETRITGLCSQCSNSLRARSASGKGTAGEYLSAGAGDDDPGVELGQVGDAAEGPPPAEMPAH